MKSYVKYIGLVDKEDKIHSVQFTTGVNIITGKSSTGKSAIIEIFDYCMGSSEFNIPSGVITDNADIYFVILSIKETFLVLARKENDRKIFLKEERNLPDIKLFHKEYFDNKFFISNSDFKVNLGHYFGLDINDIDEDKSILQYTGQKKGRPSVRNIIPYLMQHQNLIANKHSLFYRFDENEKREQTIDQFKIFAGFVTQEYYILKQNLANSKKQLKKLENEEKAINNQMEFSSKKIDTLLEEYEAISGKKIFEESSNIILSNPANYIDRLAAKDISIDENNDESIEKLSSLEKEYNKLLSEKRKLVYRYNNINSSIEYAKKYKEELSNNQAIAEASINVATCPFCTQETNVIANEANQLEEAINWLNIELRKSPYLLDSFESDKNNIKEEILIIDEKIKSIKNEIEQLNKITKSLEDNRSLNEQALKAKLKIENLLESLIDRKNNNIEEKIKAIEQEISGYEKLLKDKFDLGKQLKEAEKYINNKMKEIGNKLDFESSYKPINLKFSLTNFDLWHEKENKDKVYLRSMGSGANWLYSHITLFLALHNFFCFLSNKSLVPPILFLDQPSQVYFPTSIKDENDEFNIDHIEEKKGTNTKDEDLKAVTNLFNQLVSFCKTTLKETGIEPQIIITDHADKLELDGVDFENLVDGRRWRTMGFINSK
ncbi:DUF3732 domain-containing protein [Campylobacter concisus]|uniref:DUF3732 domain-containing protein n=1 Tax=Campylobacter concisus TaxID=199 RepID=A0A7S9R662_9BACT|nr:DUF3732 domain-containing protein [Campylobacter concisus]QPH83653.1 DUF3732 domain-containing protein [Campylobacter concisus]